MSALFSDHAGAVLSDCGRYRYRLWRRWSDASPLCFVMLNPSTANALDDDPTIRKCIGFARRLGHGAIEVVNLFAWRSTDPLGLRIADDPVGPDNDASIEAVLEHVDANSGRVICAWGSHRQVWGTRVHAVLRMIEHTDSLLPLALTVNADGMPAHPLMLPYHLVPTEWGERP